MPAAYSASIGLLKQDRNDLDWDVPLNANVDALDATSCLASIAVRANEYPSTTLAVHVSGGEYRKADGSTATFAPAVVTLPASSTVSIYLDAAGAVQQSTGGFPAAVIVKVAVVATGTTAIVSVADARVALTQTGPGAASLPLAGGTLADGANVAVGTGTGTKLGTSAAQKLGFYGATPVAQPAGSSQAAIGALTLTLTTPATIGATNSADQSPDINTNFAAIRTELAQVAADLVSIMTLANALRSAGVLEGLIKGSS